MKILISIPITVFFLVRLFVTIYLIKRIPQKVKRKEFINLKQINAKLGDLVKPLFIAAAF